MNIKQDKTLSYAQQLDQQDELKHYRKEFYINPEEIYFDGNSLGLLSKRAETALMELLESWKQHGIDGWTEGKHPWFYLSEKLGEMSAPLVGAESNVLDRRQQISTSLLQHFTNPKVNERKF